MQEVHEEQINWYEATLSLDERKSRGHFSTPPLLIEHILDACGYTPEANLQDIRVLDPACGSGNFLAGAARRLVAYGASSNMGQDDLITLIQRNIWGFDPDPISCLLAEMQLNSIAQSPVPTPWHLHQADGLAFPWGSDACVDLFLANPPYLAAKNTDLSAYLSAQQRGQADSYLLFLNLGVRLVRPNGWLGLVLPDPVLARANAAKERARLLEECTIHHLWHLAGVFSAQVGAVVIIAQKSPAKSTHAVSWLREKWGDVGATLLTGTAPTDEKQHASTVNQSLFRRQPAAELRYLLGSEATSTIELLHACLDKSSPAHHNFAPLSEFLSLRRGEEIGQKSPLLIQALHPLHPLHLLHLLHSQLPEHSMHGLNEPSPLSTVREPGHPQGDVPTVDESASQATSPTVGVGLAPTLNLDPQRLKSAPIGLAPTFGHITGGFTSDQAWYPVLRGGRDIRPYATMFSDWWIAREAILKPLTRYFTPKLFVVKSTDRLQAALDTHGYVALQTLYMLHPREPETKIDDLYFFLALLNSRLLQQYVYVLHTAYKWVQPQIEQHVLARLPIPLGDAATRQQISDNARQLAVACSELDPVVEWKEHIQRMYEEQERTICALYASALIRRTHA
ncbi:MAG: N-6 DNA methylase [Ktedonobacteraceae bacterium]